MSLLYFVKVANFHKYWILVWILDFALWKKTTKFSPRKINIDLAIYALKSACGWLLCTRLYFQDEISFPWTFLVFFCTFAPFNLDPFSSLKMKNQAPATMLNLLRWQWWQLLQSLLELYIICRIWSWAILGLLCIQPWVSP